MLVHDRNPESMLMVPRVCLAVGDCIPANVANPRISSRIAFFFEKSLETLVVFPGTIFGTPNFFRLFRTFNLPQHSLMLSSRNLDLSSGIQDFLFFFWGGGIRDPGSGLWDLGLQASDSRLRDLYILTPDQPPLRPLCQYCSGGGGANGLQYGWSSLIYLGLNSTSHF